MTRIIHSESVRMGSARERLTGTRACPNRSVIGPPGKPQGVGPSSNAGEEMALLISGEVARSHVNNASLVNVSGGDEVFAHEVSEPLSCVWIVFIVIRAQGSIRIREADGGFQGSECLCGPPTFVCIFKHLPNISQLFDEICSRYDHVALGIYQDQQSRRPVARRRLRPFDDALCYSRPPGLPQAAI